MSDTVLAAKAAAEVIVVNSVADAAALNVFASRFTNPPSMSVCLKVSIKTNTSSTAMPMHTISVTGVKIGNDSLPKRPVYAQNPAGNAKTTFMMPMIVRNGEPV